MHILHMKSLALSIGVSWGAFCLLLGWVSPFYWGDYLVDVMSSFYICYKPGFIGGIAGGLWGFAQGALLGVAISFFYNLFAKMEEKKKTHHRHHAHHHEHHH